MLRGLPAGTTFRERGGTSQSCVIRNHFSELTSLGIAQSFGVSTQDTEYQCEAVARLHLPFPLLSDHRLSFATASGCQSSRCQGWLIKRLPPIAHDGVIEHVFYPVFPPHRNADAPGKTQAGVAYAQRKDFAW